MRLKFAVLPEDEWHFDGIQFDDIGHIVATIYEARVRVITLHSLEELYDIITACDSLVVLAPAFEDEFPLGGPLFWIEPLESDA